MVLRFSLYGTPDQWRDNIQEDINGQWVKWNVVKDYINYALEHGFVPILPEDYDEPTVYMAGIDKTSTPVQNEIDDFLPELEDEGDTTEDIYDLIVKDRYSESDE